MKPMEKLSDQKRRLVEDNLNLIFYTLNLMNVRRASELYENLYSASLLWLCLAAQNFREDINTKFSTYAVAFLKRQILWYHGESERSVRTDTSIEGEEFRLCSDRNEICDSEDKIFAEEIKKIMKTELSKTQALIFSGSLKGKKTATLSRELNLNSEKIRYEKAKAISKIRKIILEGA